MLVKQNCIYCSIYFLHWYFDHCADWLMKLNPDPQTLESRDCFSFIGGKLSVVF